MKFRLVFFPVLAAVLFIFTVSCQKERNNTVTIPFILDHNRMLIDAEFQRKDGSWQNARLWIDSGNPDFFINEELARDLGMLENYKAEDSSHSIEVPPPARVRIGGMELDFAGVNSSVMFEPRWLFSTMHNHANLPATVLQKYHVIFDYPNRQLTLSLPGQLEPRGIRVSAAVNQSTGIIQIDAVIDGEDFSFALDNGASFSYMPEKTVERLLRQSPDLPHSSGAYGCMNIWGWWPGEQSWSAVRLPEIKWGSIQLSNIAIAGLPDFFENGIDVGTWYSQKTANPVNGFLGPNVFKEFRIEIDYADSAVYFEKGVESAVSDMDIVGLTLRPEADGRYKIIGIAVKDGKPTVEGIEAGDILVEIDGLRAKGATMGTVVDALRGEPGEEHTLLIERDGRQFEVKATVIRIL